MHLKMEGATTARVGFTVISARPISGIMPIAETLYAIFTQGKSPHDALRELTSLAVQERLRTRASADIARRR